MKKVYVVFGGYAYEGSEMLHVFKSKKNAKKKIEEIKADPSESFDDVWYVKMFITDSKDE